MRVEILNFLRGKENYISGEDLAHRFKLTRQGLWKHIQELRSLGYDIVAVPHLGYKLLKVPDKLYSWEIKYRLNAKIIGGQVSYYDKISSTMDAAWDLGKNGAPEGTVVCAEHQTKGRGRLGRKWISPQSKGLYFSIILRPDILPQKIPCITLLSAVAAATGIKRTTNLSLSIKWPNDILIENKKLAGILTELNAEQDRINFVVVGIGINVNNSRTEMPEEAVSLYLSLHKRVNRLDLIRSILEEFERIYLDFKINGPDLIINKWRELSYIWGSKVKVLLASRTIKGQALDLDSDGALLVRTDSGVIEKVVAGDVAQMRPRLTERTRSTSLRVRPGQNRRTK